MDSPYLATFADLLRPPSGGSVRDGVIGDLAEYHRLTPEQVVDRCLHSEEESIQEWREATDLADFYSSIDSWTFNLLWYAYLQTAGFGYPETIVVADKLGEVPANARMLDLGSGVGATAQFFAALGYEVALADVSPTLLDFARWRLERRGVKATYLQLPTDLPQDQYDLITALDVMAHVADPAETARQVHRALHPGGLFIANFDVRRKELQYAWHLHEDDLPLRWAIERAGFTPVRLIDNMLWVYKAEPTTGVGWRLRTALGWLRMASPPVRAFRATRRALARAAFAAVTRLRAAG
jgi:SAM-dependent methyltransferase